MNLDLSPNQIEGLNALSAQTGKEVQELVGEAVSKMLAYNEWFRAQVRIGLDQIQRGAFIEEAEMDARVQQILRS